MITGLGSARSLAEGKHGAFYNTLEEFHKYWERIDIVSPHVSGVHREQILFGNVHVHISPWPLFLHPIYFVWKCIQLCRAHRFNLMTVHDFPPFYNGIAARLIHAWTRVPYILEIMHIPGYPRAASLLELFYRGLTKMLVAWEAGPARAVRTINKTETPSFLIGAGVPGDKIRYIPAFYIDTSVFKPVPEIDKKYDIVYVARLEKNKGIQNLIEAVSLLKKEKSDISLFVVGSGPLRTILGAQIHRLGLEKNIHFAGWLTGPQAVAEAMSSARIFVNPALNEGGPRVALEAMACGLPLVTTRVGVMNDIIHNRQNGLFAGWKAPELADAIKSMLGDVALQEQCSREGIATVTIFEKAAAIEHYAHELQKLI